MRYFTLGLRSTGRDSNASAALLLLPHSATIGSGFTPARFGEMQIEAAMTDPVKIYCETSALEGNAHQDTAEAREAKAAIQALKKADADGLIKLNRSLVNLREVSNTKDATKRAGLTADYEELAPIPKDERVLGVSQQYDQLGGCISNVFESDTQDEKMRDSILSIGIKQKDTEHPTQAICKDFDYFLTRDRGIIRYRDQIERSRSSFHRSRFALHRNCLPS